jgi:hypothetical protein
VEAKALAESKDVTVALVDRLLNEKLRTANVLEVLGEGATLRVPLEGSAAAFARLDECFDKNSREGVEANPFARFFTAEDQNQGLPTIALETAAKEGRFENEGCRVRKDGVICHDTPHLSLHQPHALS